MTDSTISPQIVRLDKFITDILKYGNDPWHTKNIQGCHEPDKSISIFPTTLRYSGLIHWVAKGTYKNTPELEKFAAFSLDKKAAFYNAWEEMEYSDEYADHIKSERNLTTERNGVKSKARMSHPRFCQIMQKLGFTENEAQTMKLRAIEGMPSTDKRILLADNLPVTPKPTTVLNAPVAVVSSPTIAVGICTAKMAWKKKRELEKELGEKMTLEEFKEYEKFEQTYFS